MANQVPANAIDLEALMWRQGGMWKVAIRVPTWLFNDINEAEQPVTVLLRDGANRSSSAYTPIYDWLLSNVKFEFIRDKKDDE